MAWATRMRNGFTHCGLWDLIEGREVNDGSVNWTKKNTSALNAIFAAITDPLIAKIQHCSTAADCWKVFTDQFGQMGMGSVQVWARALARSYTTGKDVGEHIVQFEGARQNLASSGFIIPDHIAAILLVTTFSSDPADPYSWNAFTSTLRITPTTTFSTIANAFLDEARRRSANAPESFMSEGSYAAIETAARSTGLKFCRNCKRTGHEINTCYSKGGGMEGKGPRQKDKKKKGKKAKEKANTVEDEGGEDSNVVFEKCLSTNFSTYASGNRNDTSLMINVPPGDDDLTYRARISSSTPTIILDSGTTSHIHSVRSDFVSYAPPSSTQAVSGFGDGTRKIEGRGEVQILSSLPKGHSARLRLRDTCYVPNSHPTLISVPRLDEAQCYTLFGDGKCIAFENSDGGQLLRKLAAKQKLVLIGTKGPDRLYHLDMPGMADISYSTSTTDAFTKLEMLHHRLGHLNYSAVKSLVRRNLIRGIMIPKTELNADPPSCEACRLGKSHRASFPPSERERAAYILDRVYSDLWGPAPVTSLGGNRYAMTFTDSCTRWVWVYFLKHKNEALDAFKDWLVMVENETGRKLKIWHCDNGGEFINAAFLALLKERGIQLETTSPYTPEQNPIAERQNRSLVERAITILIDAKLPKSLWAHAFAYMAFVKNRQHSAALPLNQTPFTLRYGCKPHIRDFHRFGCAAWVHIAKHKRDKLAPRAERGIFVGYSDTQKAFRIYLPSKRSCVSSIHVNFDDRIHINPNVLSEGEYDYASFKSPLPRHKDDDDDDIQHIEPQLPPIPQPAQLPVPPPAPAPAPPPPLPPVVLRRSARQRTAPVPDDDERYKVTSYTRKHRNPGPADHGRVENEGDGSEVQGEPPDQANLSLSEPDPQTFKEAMNAPDADEWFNAMEEELHTIMAMGSYELVSCPPDRKPIGTKWVYHRKRDAIGDVSRLRARLVAQGYTQIPGIDFFETHAPVVSISSLRALLSIVAINDWEAHSVDVDSAFLNSDIDQPIYCKQPPGFAVKGKEDHVWLLLKALYGLKQAGYLWYKKLQSILVNLGFNVCRSDPCVFIRFIAQRIAIISTHVDDLGLYTNTKDEMALVKKEIAIHVPIKDSGELTYLLGIEILRDRQARTISLSHRRYIDTVLERYGMSKCNPVSSPIDPNVRLTRNQSAQSDEDQELMKHIPYQSAVGALMHPAVMTRPDIAHAVQQVAQFMSNPGNTHWTAVKRIFRYLKGSRNYVLTLGGKDVSLELTAYSDSDFAMSKDNGRSISGTALFLGTGCFLWSSKKQTVVALSTVEAELYAAVQTGRDIIWMRQFLEEIGFPQTSPTTLHIDASSTIDVMENEAKVSARTRHIDIRHFWIREKTRARLFIPQHIATQDNVADVMTKGLRPPDHQRMMGMLGMQVRADAR